MKHVVWAHGEIIYVLTQCEGKWFIHWHSIRWQRKKLKLPVKPCLVYYSKGGWSANKFPKSQIRKFADLTLFRFVDLPQMYQFAYLRIIYFLWFANLRFADPIFLADLRLPQIRKCMIFLLTETPARNYRRCCCCRRINYCRSCYQGRLRIVLVFIDSMTPRLIYWR